MEIYNIHTDGSAKGTTPNYYGGWAAIITKNEIPIDILKGNRYPATNNEMELTALLEATKFAFNLYKENKDILVNIYTDSSYSLNSITNWMYVWSKNGWQNTKKQTIANLDIMKEFYELLSFVPTFIKYHKVKGHNGDFFNEMADDYATEMSAECKKERIEKE